MKQASAKEIPREQALFTAVWNFLKKYYYITQDDPDAWDALIEESNAILEQYSDGKELERLTVNLLVDVTGYLEAKAAREV